MLRIPNRLCDFQSLLIDATREFTFFIQNVNQADSHLIANTHLFQRGTPHKNKTAAPEWLIRYIRRTPARLSPRSVKKSAVFATRPGDGDIAGRPWQGRQSSTAPFITRAAGLPRLCGRSLRKSHYAPALSSRPVCHAGSKDCVDRSAGLSDHPLTSRRPGDAPYVARHARLCL